MILVDTHVVLWLALQPDRISRKAKSAIEDTRHKNEAVAIPDIALLEIATLVARNRISLTASLETFLQEIEARFVVLPMTGRICAQAMAFPSSFPKDPADRVIAATALVHGLPLVTADAAIRRSKSPRTIW